MPRIGSEEYKENVRKKITNVALEVFAKKGYRQATMGDVAKQMNVTKPTIYIYFKNKEQLLSLWLEIISEVPRNAAVKKIVLKNLETRRKIIEEAIEDRRRKKLIT